MSNNVKHKRLTPKSLRHDIEGYDVGFWALGDDYYIVRDNAGYTLARSGEPIISNTTLEKAVEEYNDRVRPI